MTYRCWLMVEEGDLRYHSTLIPPLSTLNLDMVPIPTDPTDRDLRWFGGLGMVFLWGAAVWLTFQHDAVEWGLALAGVGLVSGVIAWWKPRLLRRIYIGWMVAVFPIGWLIGHALLAVVYFAVLTPVGWLLRLAGHDPLQRRPDRSETTYWQPRTRARKPADYFRQF